LLEQSYIACMPVLTASSTVGEDIRVEDAFRKKMLEFPQQYHLCAIIVIVVVL